MLDQYIVGENKGKILPSNCLSIEPFMDDGDVCTVRNNLILAKYFEDRYEKRPDKIFKAFFDEEDGDCVEYMLVDEEDLTALEKIADGLKGDKDFKQERFDILRLVQMTREDMADLPNYKFFYYESC